MAVVDRRIFVKVVTLDPVSGLPIPVPDARVLVQHRVQFWFDERLSQGEPVTGRDGIAEVVLRFEESTEASLDPYFTLTLPDGLREVSSGELSPARPSFTLPREWESRHGNRDRITNLPSFTNRTQPFTVYMGFGAQIRLSYGDYRGGLSDPIALPENTVELALVDEDIFFDDTLTGVGYNLHENRMIPLGKTEGDDQNEGLYPYFDNRLTVPYVLDMSAEEAAQPRAWVDPPGAPLGLLGGGSFQQVGPLAVDLHGFVFMVDPASTPPVIHRFYPDGTLCETLAAWTEGGNAAQFQQPRGLALDGNRRLLVTDGQSVLVFRLNDSSVDLSPTGQLPDGAGQYQFSHRWGGWAGDPLEGDKSFGEPQGIAVLPSSDGREELLAVADARGGAFSAVGVHVFVVGSTGSFGPETLGHRVSITLPEGGIPTAVAGNQAGQLIVASRSQHRVSSWQLQTSGVPATATQTWQVGSTAGNSNSQFDDPVAVAVDAKHGVVYVADANNRRVQLLNGADGSFLVTWGNPYAVAPANSFGPGAIAIDHRSEIYLTDLSNQRVVRATAYAANGTPLGPGIPPRPVATWTPRSELPHLHQPAYVHLDQRGYLWVSDTGNNRVLNYLANPVTGDFQLARTIIGLNAPVGVTTAPDGEVFIVESGANRIVQLGATESTPTTTTPNPPLDRPRGIVFGLRPSGPAVYVADIGNSRILRINADGTTASLNQAGPGSALNAPEDLAIDSQGRLIVADTGNNRLVRFNPDDSFDQIIRLNDPSYGLEAPTGLSITPDDQLLITDRRRQRVVELSVLGSGRSVAISLRRFWDCHRFVPQVLYGPHRAGQPSRVRYAGGLRVEATADYFGSRAFRVVASGLIELLEGANVRQTIALRVGDLVLVEASQSVEKLARIAIVSSPRVFNSDLARQILLAAPSRAVLTPRGVLAIADPGHHRVRLLRIHTNLAANLFDLGLGFLEGNPDIYLRGRSRFDWRRRPDIRLQVAAGPGVDSFGDPAQWKTPTQDDYTADTLTQTNTLTDRSPLQARAIHALGVMRQVQRWMVHTTRTDVADQRWGREDGPDVLAAELLDNDDGSYHHFFTNVISLGAALSGRGHDAWDDSVIAHEMGHWIFDYTLLRPQMDELRGPYPGSKEHFANYLYQASIAMVEGYAEYIALFWGDEYALVDRFRGSPSFDLNQLTPQRPGLVERPPDQVNDLSPVDLYHQRNLGLLSEGYFANTLWQIHHAVADPGIRFADAPSYWWGYNSRLTEAQSQRLVDLLRVPFRQFPTNSSGWVATPTEHSFRQILAQAHSQHADCVPLIQQIYEINNQLMPQLRLRRLEGVNPGAAVSGSLTLAPEVEVNLVADLRDATGAVLVDHNLMFRLEGGGSLTLITPAGTPTRGGTISDSLGSGYTDERPTNAQGEVRFTYRAPAASPEPHQFKMAYRPRFASDFPQRADSREVALQKLYMQALHQVGPTAKLGFELTLAVEVHLL